MKQPRERVRILSYRTDRLRETRPFQAPYLAWNQLQLQLALRQKHKFMINIIRQRDNSVSFGESDSRAGDADGTAGLKIIVPSSHSRIVSQELA